MEDRKAINLLPEHRGTKSSTFTGRPQGKQVREKLKLDTTDKDSNKYFINIPSNTISFNASFYLGLFFDSIEHLKGFKNFKDKYRFKILEENGLVKEGLMEDLKECERQAINEYNDLK
ncbi:hypothetical protein [Autumnicola psychrophila]|uniref:DUF4325 domain-containing protein n=1 Tax=Autumnicola psychrophila TaxID=3075592 RepID=A0ABU3DVB4_9FLAO|nr:hypothetical protein [Zunongwangia sp. F225]MDT0687664.1 hypothetical protein [Zunongwangia sp. F225]